MGQKGPTGAKKKDFFQNRSCNATSFSFFFVKSLHVNFRADFNIPFILAPYNVGRGRLVLHPKFRPENGSDILVSRIKVV